MENHDYMSYKKIRQIQSSFELRKSEIPIEYSLSLPLPTLRWGKAGYASFACNTLRIPGVPTEQNPPDIWWLINAVNRRLLLYAHFDVLPYVRDVDWHPVILPKVQFTIAQLKEQLNYIEILLDQLAPKFFSDIFATQEDRSNFTNAFSGYIPSPLLPFYETLVPDFFDWLKP